MGGRTKHTYRSDGDHPMREISVSDMFDDQWHLDFGVCGIVANECYPGKNLGRDIPGVEYGNQSLFHLGCQYRIIWLTEKGEADEGFMACPCRGIFDAIDQCLVNPRIDPGFIGAEFWQNRISTTPDFPISLIIGHFEYGGSAVRPPSW